MTKLHFIPALILAALLSGCGDGVPKVSDPSNIVVNGKTMSQQNFLTEFCAGKTDHETCNAVQRAMVAESTKSKSGPARF